MKNTKRHIKKKQNACTHRSANVGDTYEVSLHGKSGQKGFHSFQPPIPYSSLMNELRWKPREGSIHAISDEDYDTVVASADEEYVLQREMLENESEQDNPPLTEPPSYGKRKVKLRSKLFERRVKNNYEYSCAVCGRSRFTRGGHPEVESAHIYPRAKNGSNEFSNGIALCKLHHWAFENGLFSIEDDYSIVVYKRIRKLEDYREISRFEEEKIRLPKRNLPHKKFLAAYRKLHDFK